MVGQHIVLGHCSLRLETMLDGTINVIMRPPHFFQGVFPFIVYFSQRACYFQLQAV